MMELTAKGKCPDHPTSMHDTEAVNGDRKPIAILTVNQICSYSLEDDGKSGRRGCRAHSASCCAQKELDPGALGF